MALQLQKVRVLRAFFYQGVTQAVGETPTLPKVFALEMKAANKCELLADEPPAAARVGGAASAPDKPQQPQSKGNSDAK